MAGKLIEAGHEVTMVCGSYGVGHTGLTQEFNGGRREGVVDGIQVIEFNLAYSNKDSFSKRTWLFTKFALRSIGLALTQRYDVLFATTTPLTAGLPGIFARWLRGRTFVFEVRDLWPELPREMGVIKNPIVLWLMGVLEWLSYRSAHRLVGLAPGIVDGITRCGVDRAKVAMIPNGCDLSIFSDKSQPWRPKGVAASDLMAVYTGTHGIANGLDAVLDAAGTLKRRGRDGIKIVLIGEGKLKPALEARASAEGLTNVVFHAPVDKQALAGLMASTGVGLQILANVPAFYYGTSPNKFFDYLAAGLPVLCNYPGWLAEMIAKNQCGFAVPPNNAGAFADALEYAAAHRDELRIMGSNSRKLADNQFDRAELSSQFVDWITAWKKPLNVELKGRRLRGLPLS